MAKVYPIKLESVLIVVFFIFIHKHSLNQTDNAAKIPNIGAKPTSNGNGINNSMKLNNNSSNGSINETNGKAVSVDEVSLLFVFLVYMDIQARISVLFNFKKFVQKSSLFLM